MAKLLYVEPNDEITDLVDRIRRAEGDRDLVFVVPPDGRVLRSPLDMRLLMQYTRGFQKRIAIVSGDPQVQAQAIRTGFPTFASLARLEQGAPLRGVPEVAGAGAAAAGAGEAATAAAAGAAVMAAAQPASTELAKRGPTALLAAGSGGAAGWVARIREMWDSPQGRQRLIAISAAGVAVLLILLMFILPSATITLGVQAHRLADTATIQGTDGPSSGPTLDQVTTQALQSQTFTQNFTATPSGTQALPPVPATGTLQFCGSPSGPHGPLPPYYLTFTGAPSFVDSSSVVFTTTSTSANGSYTVPGCTGPGSGTVGIPVQANSTTTVGTAGNVGANQSWSWDGSGGQVDVGAVDPSKIQWTLTNPTAMSGGANATTQSVFSTSDAATALQQQQTIDTNLTSKADKQLKRLADKSVIAVDSAGNGVTVTVTNPTLPTGCNTSASTPCPAATPQTLTVSVSAAATAYSPAAVKAAVLQDLKSKVPAKSELLANPNLGTPEVVAAGAGGTVTITARAVGYWAPSLDLKPFQSKLAFMSPAAAKTYLLARLPGASTVTISQSPFGWPWLPILSGNIHLVRISLAQSHSTG
ncbi:MAG TPA: hypothetical protein VNH20_07145 [Candidatus Dormibacteraeota bacterium]|nr:hypothetical protein [Candidatus Dormibacteraeota bacterium]